ncbi:hypothetical protein Tco_1138597 [Tanacetum coccineum]
MKLPLDAFTNFRGKVSLSAIPVPVQLWEMMIIPTPRQGLGVLLRFFAVTFSSLMLRSAHRTDIQEKDKKKAKSKQFQARSRKGQSQKSDKARKYNLRG